MDIFWEFHSSGVVRYKGLGYQQKVNLTKGVQPDTNFNKWKSLGVCASVESGIENHLQWQEDNMNTLMGVDFSRYAV